MKATAFVLGLIGSFTAFAAALFAGALGGLGTAFHTSGSHEAFALGASAWLASILGLVGSSLVWRYPSAAWICMLLATVWIVISVSAFGIPGGLLLFMGSVFAFVEGRRQRGVLGAKVSQ